ncbi:MAG: O-antigen ligase family protein [Alistipes sp.]
MTLFDDISDHLSQIVLYTCILAGVYGVWYAFSHFGLVGGVAVSLIPAILCVLYVTLKDPAMAMMLLFIVNYFIMGIGRYLQDKPIGVLLDGMIAFCVLMLLFQAMYRKVDWRRAATGLTLAATIWLVYALLQLVNPESVSTSGWFSGVRSISFYFFAIVILAQIILTEYKYLRYILYIWSVLTLLAVIKSLIQKYVGFDATETYWLYVLGGSSTHIIHSGIRYFSFFSDAANFGANMGLSMVVLSISALYFENKWLKTYLFFVAAAAFYGLLISGTRSAIAVPFIGYTVFIIMSKNLKIILVGAILLVGAFSILNFTQIGQSNALVRRARSTFDTNDPSFVVRLENQAKLRVLMADKPFGAGVGHGGGKAKVFAPNSPISQIPTDSWFVMIWVEMGIVGLLLHVSILCYILLYGCWLVMFKLKNKQLRGLIAALIAGIAGVIVNSYANEIFGQIPIGAIMYFSMSFIFLSPRFDREITERERQIV